MATKIVTKNSSTASAAPTASDLVQGELAVNVTDKRLYTENNSGAIVELGTNPAGAVTMASTLAVTGNVDFNGDLDVDGTTNLDVVDIDGAVDMASTLTVAGVLTGTSLDISGDIDVDGTTNLDVVDIDGAVDMASTLTVTAEITANGGIALGDNDKATFGAGDDLQIYHDAYHSYIKEIGAGSLILDGANILFRNADASKSYASMTDGAAVDLYHNNALKLATTSTGIDVAGTVVADGLTVQQSSGANILLESTTTGATTGDIFGEIEFKTNDSSSAGVKGKIDSYSEGGVGNGALRFFTGDTTGLYERMRITSSGKLLLGDSASHTSDLLQIETPASGGGHGIQIRRNDSNTDQGVGSITFGNNTATDLASISAKTDGASDNGALLFNTSVSGGANTERMRIDSAGNVLVGTTATDTAAVGFRYRPSLNAISSVADGGVAAYFGRRSSDGDIVTFRKDDATVGSIGSVAGGYLSISGVTGGRLQINGTDEYAWDTTQFYPSNDNANDLGFITKRWDDVYATNGTIQTSDRNEKQDIEELSEAEQRIAVACKGLMRKFRWKDSVAEKGDDARTHFGIIAQDLQAAFVAEGLDAGDYAMFISTTWWETQTEVDAVVAVEAVEFVQAIEAVDAVEAVYDEDGLLISEAVDAVEAVEGVDAIEAVEAKDAYTRTDTFYTEAEAPEGATERTRLGVRYSELLAFIISAI